MPVLNLPTDFDKSVFMKAIKKFEITEEELSEGFWKAYADPYVPASGIEFRHIFKYVEVMRKGEARKTFTYEEMLNDSEKKGIPQDSYSMIDEKDSQGRKKWVLR